MEIFLFLVISRVLNIALLNNTYSQFYGQPLQLEPFEQLYGEHLRIRDIISVDLAIKS